MCVCVRMNVCVCVNVYERVYICLFHSYTISKQHIIIHKITNFGQQF